MLLKTIQPKIAQVLDKEGRKCQFYFDFEKRNIKNNFTAKCKTMLRIFSSFLLKLLGWTVTKEFIDDLPDKCVVTAAPHTSNWDGLIMRATFSVLRIPMRWALKDEFMKFPFKLIFGPLGAIGINRRPKKEGEKRQSTTEAIADLFNHHDKLWLAIAPEGTRSLRKEWKTGFYYIAKTANVPIAFGFLDFKNKRAGVGGYLIPGDDFEADLRKIVAFYAPIQGKNPELFSPDLRYFSTQKEEKSK